MRSPKRPGVILGIAGIAVVTAANPVAATSEPPDGGGDIVVVDEGKGDERIDLNAPMVEGTVGHSVETTEGTGEIHVTGSQTIDAEIDGTTTGEQTAEVTDVADDGGYTIVRVVESYDFTVNAGPAELAESLRDDEELEPLVGISLEQTYDATRRLLAIVPADDGMTLTPDQQAAVDQIIEDDADSPPFPDVELGVGAVWTAEFPGAKDATARYELSLIANGQATIDVTFDGDAASLMQAAGLSDVAGTVSGNGTYTQDLGNPLDASGELTVNLDVTGTTAQGDTLTMVIESTNTRVVTLDS